MSARNELAGLLSEHGFEGYSMAYDGRESSYCQCGAPVYPRLTLDQHRADAILAAGYTKPRTITTAEELDKLPFGSVILDPIGLSLHKNEFTGWRASNGAKNIPAEILHADALPATVLYEPSA